MDIQADRSVQSGDAAYEESRPETVARESGISGPSNGATRTKESFYNINAIPESYQQTEPVSFLSGLDHSLMDLESQPTGNMDQLSMAIEYQNLALVIAKEKGRSTEVVLSLAFELSRLLQKRWESLNNISDIGEAIECMREAIILYSGGARQRAFALTRLGSLLLVRFGRLNDLADLNQAIEYLTLAVQLIPEGDPCIPELLNCFAALLICRHEETHDAKDIDRAIECQYLGVQLAPDDHKAKSNLLDSLSQTLKRRYKQYRNPADIHQAIQCGMLAIQAFSGDCLNTLTDLWTCYGDSFCCRYEWTGDLSDLNRTVECHTTAARLAPADHPSRSQVLDGLGRSLLHRYERLGSLQDLNQAIQYLDSTARLASKSNTITIRRLLDLARSLQLRYLRLGNPADQDRSHECLTRFWPFFSEDQPDVTMRAGLEALFRRGGERRGSAADVDLGFKHARDTLEVLLRWGNGWRGSAADLGLAFKNMLSTINLVPDGHSHKPKLLSWLGKTLLAQFEASRNEADLDLAIQYLAQAVELAPDDHPLNPRHLLWLGRAYRARFNSTPRLPNMIAMGTTWGKAAALPIVDPKAQIECAWGWAVYLLALEQSSLKPLALEQSPLEALPALEQSPLEAFQAAFDLLPHFVWLGQTVQARYDSIPEITNLVSAAAAYAVSVGSYDMALEWLEQGRSVVWSQQLQTRTPFDDLAAINPQLANRMRGIASRLEAAELESGPTCSSADSSLDNDLQGQRHGAALQWEQLLQEVRRLPGFEDYMLPRKAHILKKAATRGPVVVINTQKARCDALILAPDHDDVMHVPLVRLNQEALGRLRGNMVALIGHRGDEDKPRGVKRHRSSESAQDKLNLLKVLWSDVVEPILSALQYTSKPAPDELPHITWCATGVLSFLPLHAAGLYDGTSRNTFDLVVSSYTPTLAALLAPNSSALMPHTGVLAVGQANTPGLTPLPKTVDELVIVGKHTAAVGYRHLDGSMATVEATLHAMEQYSWVHLACHAIQDRMDPRQSAFYLHNGKLTLETITRRAFKHKGLAFLSACQTATGDDVLPDEAMHLAAGMLAAGYPSVIATMWSIKDEDGPEIAEVVYGDLAKDAKMDHTKAAMALHSATKKLRNKVGVEAVARWAPFIHIGL
ncbi:hypothetical protein FRC12_024915 [Ceratobasidium sp. 428]|nr:hypothetical protein FRC12_024915 [Ceratobasidium sp. 428]